MSYAYDAYISEHKGNVANAFYWIRDNLPELITMGIPEETAIGLETQITHGHDLSKITVEEYAAYDAYFYGGNISSKVLADFNRAWLTHIHRNPHHWQHWVLISDDEVDGVVPLDMPYEYILEMICDWWSFSWKQGTLKSMFSWYNEHKDYIMLSRDTRTHVEYVLATIYDKLSEVQNEKV